MPSTPAQSKERKGSNFAIWSHCLICRSPSAYSSAKDRLTTESRHFVTASKLFVKSATENGNGQERAKLLECLSHCVQMVDRIGQVGRITNMLLHGIL